MLQSFKATLISNISPSEAPVTWPEGLMDLVRCNCFCPPHNGSTFHLRCHLRREDVEPWCAGFVA